MNFLERMKIGWRIGIQTYAFIFEHKKTVLFLFIPLVGALPLLVLFVNRLFVYRDGGYPVEQCPIPVLVFYIFLIFFITKLLGIISEVALSFYVGNILDGRQEKGFFECISRSLSRIGTLIAWVFSAFILLIVSETLRRKKSALLSFLDFILQLSWSVATFFVIPFFAFEDGGIVDSIKKSSALVIKIFGQHVEYHVGFGVINVIAMIITMVVSFVMSLFFFMIVSTGPLTRVATSFDVSMIFIILFVMMSTYCITSAAHIIFKTAVYNFGQGKSIGSFDKESIISSFVSEKN